MLEGRMRGWLRSARPWLILAGVAGLALWHVLDFSEVRDTDFPRIVRPFFNPWPPAAYRLAEPGDTLDRLGLYFASAASALAFLAIAQRLRSRPMGGLALWPTALALALAAAWHASTPGPTFDGWHGLGWRAIFDPTAPTGLRVALGLAAIGLACLVLVNLAVHVGSAIADLFQNSFPRSAWECRPRRSASVFPRAAPPGTQSVEDGIPTQSVGTRVQNRSAIADPTRALSLLPLLAFAVVFVLLRQVEIPGLGPAGYWPRCAFDLGLLAFALALIRARPFGGSAKLGNHCLAFATICGLLICAGISVSAYHRPLARLHAVVPGKIYISAMPSYRALSIEQARLHFKTIINLFDEASTQGSPYHDEEIRFVREHGLRYLGSPSDGLESDRFLDETLALAQDPSAWPILIHCHGCMDRSPAWMGLYRFLVEGKPLDEVFREIERHRGSRPKAIVSLQYNRKLPPRAPDRFASDSTCLLLVRCVAGTEDPFLRPNWNRTATTRSVVTRIEPDPSIRRP